MNIRSVSDLAAVDFTKDGGTVTVVVQHHRTRDVLMVAHADREALERTLDTGEMHFRSRTRGLWHKGATSGNTQSLISMHADCDRDAILALVEPAGPACHDGTPSCFASAPADALRALDDTVASRAATPVAGSYTNRLLDDRNLRLKKLGEEAAELVVACADGDRSRAVSETADVMYHALVALRASGASLDDVLDELRRRAQGSSPTVEK